MISIKRLLEQRRRGTAPDADVVESLTQAVRILLEAISTHVLRGNETDLKAFRRSLSGLLRQMEGPQPALAVLGVASEAVDALQNYCDRTGVYLREQHEERQAMIAMLTDTVAELAGQTDASSARLWTIEKQVERASELDDIRTLRTSLAESLQSLRDAAAQQRSSSVETIERLKGQIAVAQSRLPKEVEPAPPGQTDFDLVPEAPEEPTESPSTTYVAAFKLQRAEHISSRFGEAAKGQMLAMIATQLKTVLRGKDRLLRWKGTSFVMFINSTDTIQEVRARLGETIAATSQQYIEVGRKSAMLSVGVDWFVFPQSNRPLEAVFAEVDAFLANVKQTPPPAMARR